MKKVILLTRKTIVILTFFFFQVAPVLSSEKGITLKLLQLNVWLEGTAVENGFEHIVQIILQTNADLITLSEVENYNNIDFIKRLTDTLTSTGQKYYGQKSYDTGLISKFPITKQQVISPWLNDQGSITKATIMIGDNRVALYSIHLDYMHYGAYLPRGYDGFTWKKLPSRVADPKKVIQFNDSSKRIREIEVLITDATEEFKKGSFVFMGGDFNEPSHLDWVESTKDMFDHNGLVIPWNCTLKLSNAGFTDAYREKYPDPLKHPGFTYPSDNQKAAVSKLTWAPDADERDRIDYIFYSKKTSLKLKEVYIVGPNTSIVRSQRIKELTPDPFILPLKGWPSDHKAVLAIFTLSNH